MGFFDALGKAVIIFFLVIAIMAVFAGIIKLYSVIYETVTHRRKK